MIALHFSECCDVPMFLPKMELIQPKHAMKRADYYERMLRMAVGSNMEFATYDELCVLIAQWLRRKNGLEIALCSWCNCLGLSENPTPLFLKMDADGSREGDSHHGFFRQRAPYLG
jgi:hypothetical protein